MNKNNEECPLFICIKVWEDCKEEFIKQFEQFNKDWEEYIWNSRKNID